MPGPIPIIITAALAIAAVKGCKTEKVSKEKTIQQHEMEKEVFEKMKHLSEYTANVSEMSEHVSNPQNLVPVYARNGNGHLKVFVFKQEKQNEFLNFAKQYGKHIKVAAAGVKVLDFAFFMSEETTYEFGKFMALSHKDKTSTKNAGRDKQIRDAFENAGEKW